MSQYMVNDESLGTLKKWAVAVYALEVAGFFTGVMFIAGVIIAYVKRPLVRGTYLETHFTWIIRTFWYSLLWGIVGGITLLVGVGFLVLLGASVWTIYRIVRGWIYLSENKPMYVPGEIRI